MVACCGPECKCGLAHRFGDDPAGGLLAEVLRLRLHLDRHRHRVFLPIDHRSFSLSSVRVFSLLSLCSSRAVLVAFPLAVRGWVGSHAFSSPRRRSLPQPAGSGLVARGTGLCVPSLLLSWPVSWGTFTLARGKMGGRGHEHCVVPCSQHENLLHHLLAFHVFFDMLRIDALITS